MVIAYFNIGTTLKWYPVNASRQFEWSAITRRTVKTITGCSGTTIVYRNADLRFCAKSKQKQKTEKYKFFHRLIFSSEEFYFCAFSSSICFAG
jgi:hypothetical protein